MTIPRSVDERGSQQRSSVSNGSRWFLDGDVDERSGLARRYRDIAMDIAADLDPNGFQGLTAARQQLVRKAAALAVEGERMEAELAAGSSLDVPTYTSLANALRRLLLTLGLDRRARDVTPDLESYLAEKGAA